MSGRKSRALRGQDVLLERDRKSEHIELALDERMQLEPWPFALSYIRRAGRVGSERLRAMAPRFTAALEARGIDLEEAA